MKTSCGSEEISKCKSRVVGGRRPRWAARLRPRTRTIQARCTSGSTRKRAPARRSSPSSALSSNSPTAPFVFKAASRPLRFSKFFPFSKLRVGRGSQGLRGSRWVYVYRERSGKAARTALRCSLRDVCQVSDTFPNIRYTGNSRESYESRELETQNERAPYVGQVPRSARSPWRSRTARRLTRRYRFSQFYVRRLKRTGVTRVDNETYIDTVC